MKINNKHQTHIKVLFSSVIKYDCDSISLYMTNYSFVLQSEKISIFLL
jgi:hypothetical protein